MIKVLSVCTSLGGGAGRAAYRIHQGVRNYGVDSRMLLKAGKCDEPSIITLEELVPRNPFYKAFDWTCNKCKNQIQHLRWNRYPEREDVFMSDLRGMDLHDALRKLDYDVLHLHWINNRFVPLKALPKDKPIVWTLHDSWPFCGVCHYFFECNEYKYHCGCCPFLHSNKSNDLSYQVWKKKESIYKELNLHIVTPSHWLCDCAKQSSLLGRFPVTVIPNCIDVNVYRPLKENEIFPRWSDLVRVKSTKKLVLFGAVNAVKDKVKGFSHLMSALETMEVWGHTDDFELVVFGVNETELDLHFPVHYVGYVSNPQEMVSLYNLADVTVIPSLSENLSCTIMESLSCGTPVVAFETGGNNDLVEHRRNGYLARGFDDKNLAEGILWCLENNGGNHLGEAAREKIIKEFCSETVCNKYKELYFSLV